MAKGRAILKSKRYQSSTPFPTFTSLNQIDQKILNQHHQILVFDLDNTLINRDQAMLHCIENTFKIQLSDAQKHEIQLKDAQGHSNRKHFCNWLRTFLKLPKETNQIWQLLRKNIGYYVTPAKEAKAVLRGLQSHHKMALLTNGGTENQTRKIAQTGINEFFPPNRIFISEQIGHKKPDPEAFQIVQDQFKDAQSFYMIGDHWEKDILGALKFGWKPVYLNPDAPSQLPEGVRAIQSLKELSTMLNEENGTG